MVPRQHWPEHRWGGGRASRALRYLHRHRRRKSKVRHLRWHHTTLSPLASLCICIGVGRERGGRWDIYTSSTISREEEACETKRIRPIDLKTLCKMTIPIPKSNYNATICRFFVVSLVVSVTTIFLILSPPPWHRSWVGRRMRVCYLSYCPIYTFWASILCDNQLSSSNRIHPLVTCEVDPKVGLQPCCYDQGVCIIHTSAKTRELKASGFSPNLLATSSSFSLPTTPFLNLQCHSMKQSFEDLSALLM